MPKVSKKPNRYCIDCKKTLDKYKLNLRCHSCENKRRYKVGILNNSGMNNGRFKSGKPKCVDCGKELAQYKGLRCKSCRNKFHVMKGRNNPAFGKSPYWKLIKYKKTWFRSYWEANFAKWCDGSGIKWEYESQRFDLGSATYTPDFYLPEFNLYVEIKGYWRADAWKKFNFVWKYFNVNLIYLSKKELLNLGVINV